MHSAFAAVAFAALAVATPVPQTESSDCESSYDGTFQIVVTNVSDSSMTKTKRQTMDEEAQLVLTLEDGVLTDDQDRIGSIVANNQFQFDPEPQPGTISAKGWAICSNGRLQLNGDDTFQQCLSGGFYNLYQGNTADQCTDIYITVTPSGTESTGQIPDGQVTGEAQEPTQIDDGQIQAPTSAAPVTQIDDGQIQASTGAAPVTQIDDGQIQAPTSVAAPVTQIDDGQIQAPTGAPVTQIDDGQIQAPTGAPVTQIDDGQIQAPTGAPVTQIPDGQIQAPTNGTNGTMTSSSPYVPVQSGEAAPMGAQAGLMGLVGAIAAVAML